MLDLIENGLVVSEMTMRTEDSFSMMKIRFTYLLWPNKARSF